MILYRSFLSLIFVVIASASLLCAQKGKGDDPISDELYAMIEKRTTSIANELHTGVAVDWAGQYWDGDHHPTVLLWAPSSGFVVTASHHTFAPSWVNYGRVVFENNRLRLYPVLAKGEKSAFELSDELVGVRWDDWRFLIPPDELVRFAYSVHSGSESQLWNFFVKPGSREKKRKGLPDMPAAYRKIMTMPAISARVLKVEKAEDDKWSSVVTLNVGKNRDLIEGMMFYYAVGSNRRNIGLLVESVSVRTATARISMLGGTDNNELEPTRGMIFSSKMPKGFIEPG